MLVNQAMPEEIIEVKTKTPIAPIVETLTMVKAAETKVSIGRDLRLAVQILLRHIPLKKQEILALANLFEPWAEEQQYEEGQIVKYGEKEDGCTALYTVQSAHISNPNQTPDTAKSLYQQIIDKN